MTQPTNQQGEHLVHLWTCNQETGKDHWQESLPAKDIAILRERMNEMDSRGIDVWLIHPNGTKELPTRIYYAEQEDDDTHLITELSKEVVSLRATLADRDKEIKALKKTLAEMEALYLDRAVPLPELLQLIDNYCGTKFRETLRHK